MTPPTMRILHIVQNLHFGGMERVIAEIVRRTNPNAFETHVLVLQYLGHFAEGLERFATLHVMQPLSRLSMLWPSKLARQIEDIRPDVVHTHSGVWYKASLAARIAGVPYLIHTDHGRQNPDPWSFRLVDGLASRRTDIVVAVSDALAKQMTPIVADPSRIRVIRNGVDTSEYQPSPMTGTMHRELGLSPDIPLIGSIGRLEVVKGYDVMVNAFAHVRQTWQPHYGPAPQLLLVGDGSQRKTLEQIARSANITDAVHFLGWRGDIGAILHDLTLFTMSSHSEGTSISLLEAMSAGLCPVVTKVGGNPAVLGEALAHRLVQPANPHALAAAWTDALTNTERCRADAHQARARVVEAFGLDAMVRQYETLYKANPPLSAHAHTRA